MNRIAYRVPVLFFCLAATLAVAQTNSSRTLADSARLAELDRYWAEVARTVREGDYDGYAASYHPDAVCVFTTGKNKRTAPIREQLEQWKAGFTDTKAGKVKNNVEFRFSQRVGDATSAHETGIFYFTSVDANGKVLSSGAVHFEGLLTKRNGVWLSLMEYQKARATQAEWEALK
ncbi:MAG: hypothetical protein ACK5DD_04215 [Cyclobacteriaceae bacterium]|jgi:hypothetical protein